MATTELKTLEKLIKQILDKVNGIGAVDEGIVKDDSLNAINEKLDSITETVEKSEDISKKIDKLSTKIDKKSKDYVKDIQEAFEAYQQKRMETFAGIEASQDAGDIKDFVSIISNEMLELKEKFENFNTEFTDVNLNTGMVVSKEILSMKNCVLALNDSVDKIKTQIEEFKPDDTIAEKMSDVLVKDVNEAFESALNTFKNDSFAVLAKISQGINKVIDNSKFMEGIEISIGEILQNQQKDKDDIIKIIKADIASENKQLLPQILQIVNSISFGEDAEEIKDCVLAVNENLGIVNKTVETIKDAVCIPDETKSEVLEKIRKIDSTIDNVSNEFTMLTRGTKEDTGAYTYTLLDLESDISKVRILLDDLSHSLQDDRSLAQEVTKNVSDKLAKVNNFVEQTAELYTSPDYKELLLQFDALNDDITSISKRTNKLILTSDDSSLRLEKHIEDFQKILVKISQTVNNFENSTVIKNIAIKTDNISKMASISMQSGNALNEAFLHLAAWIDNTTEDMAAIKTQIGDINTKLNELSAEDVEETSDAEETAKVEKLLKETNKKLAENTKIMSELDEKLSATAEFKPMLEYLVAQVQVLNENVMATKTTNKKIDKLEKQIQQLLEYVDEE